MKRATTVTVRQRGSVSPRGCLRGKVPLLAPSRHGNAQQTQPEAGLAIVSPRAATSASVRTTWERRCAESRVWRSQRVASPE